MASVTIRSDFRAQEEEICHHFYLPASICHEAMGWDTVIIFFFQYLVLSRLFPLSSFTLIKRLFSSSSLSAIRVVSSAYLRLLRFLLPILIPAGKSSSPAFLMMCSAYRVNKQGDSRQPCRTPFSVLNQSVVPYSVCFFLTHIQVSQETGKMAWYSHLLKSFPQLFMIHTDTGFGVVDETEVDGFLEFPWFPYDPANVGSLISGCSSFSKPNLDIWMFLVHIMLKASMPDFKHFLTSMAVQFSSVAQSCPTLCNPMNRSTPGVPVHRQLPEFTQTHVHRVSDAIQPSHPLSSPCPPAPNPSQHQSLFQ